MKLRISRIACIAIVLCLILTLPVLGDDWQQKAGSGKDISVGSDGTAWIIGSTPIFGGYEMHRWSGSAWVKMPGGALKVAVGSNNHVWCISDLGFIYRWNGNPDWEWMPGTAIDIGVGSDGTVWVVGSNKITDGYDLYKWDGAAWALQPGAAVKIDVGSANHVWMINEKDEIYQWVNNAWQKKAGSGKDIGIGSDGSAWIVGTNKITGGYDIYSWSGTDWTKKTGAGVAISAGFSNQIWMIDENDKIYQWTITSPTIGGCFDFNDGTSQNWTLDQLYETGTANQLTPVTPYALINDQNRLAATATPLVIGIPESTDLFDIYLESPDLSANLDWQNIEGISIDVLRTITSFGGQPPPAHFVQLQLRVIDTSDNSLHLFGENDGTNFIFHALDYNQSYHFIWKPTFLSDPKWKIKQVRVRFIGPGARKIELSYSGSWIIDNVCAEKSAVSSNTPLGSNVSVNAGNGIEITFDNVTTAGNTTVTTKTTGSATPSGFTIMPSGTPTYYDITSTAQYTGNITIAIQYIDTGMTPAQEAALTLRVYDTQLSKWTDITTSVDVNANIIYGKVSHLSEFAIMAPTGSSGGNHYTFTSNTGDSYNLVIDNATLDGNSLATGDEIGAYTPAGLCVGASVWGGTTPLALTVWADDGQTQAVDGYAAGEAMSFKVWDTSGGKEFSAVATYTQGNGTFGNGAYAQISTLAAKSTQTQMIGLAQGWSWVSTNVQPANLSMDNIFAGVTKLEIVVNNAGQFYIPNVINSIGSMNILEGYKVNVNGQDQITFTGTPVAVNTPISMTGGWNFIGYLPTAPKAVETALAPILTQLEIIKNDQGQFFIPNLINSLGNMEPGEGYKLYLKSSVVLNYPQGAASKMAHKELRIYKPAHPRHFRFHYNTGESHSVVVQSLKVNGRKAEVGDEVGLFTPSGLCVGGGVWDGSGLIGIAAWADNKQTGIVDGFASNEKMIFRFWDSVQDIETTLTPVLSRGNGTFGEEPLSLLSLYSDSKPVTFSLDQNYPNPFNLSTMISYRIPDAGQVEITVFDILGKEIKLLLKEKQETGSYSIEWNGTDESGNVVPSGVYLYRIKTGSNQSFKRAVLVK